MRWLVVGLLLFAQPVFAADLLLSASPEAPRPAETVTVSATVRGNPEAQLFSWTIDDTEVARGYGVTKLEVVMPDLGDSVTVRVAINDEELASSIVLRPQRVTIEWEGDSLRPPTYSGRPTFTAQGIVRLYAIAEVINPRGERIVENDIRYVWSVNGGRLRESGYGQSSITITPPFFNRPFTVSVRAESRSGLVGRDEIELQAQKPRVTVYELSPLLGILSQKTVSETATFSQPEVTFIAYPSTTAAGYGYTWSLNSETVEVAGDDPRIITFRKTGEGAGIYQIGFRAESGLPFDTFVTSFLLNF